MPIPNWDQQRIALGFSCQSSHTIDMTGANIIRSPFDYNIVTKDVLLDAIYNDGRPFKLKSEDFQFFRSTHSGTEGVKANGVFFWHEFDRNGISLVHQWPDQIERVIEKYDRRWRRFADVARRDDVRKQFVLSNNQHNLVEFCDKSAFDESFSIDANFLDDLVRGLRELGARNFTIDLTVRDIAHYTSLIPVIAANHDRYRARFCGEMVYPPYDAIVHETALDLLGLGDQFGSIFRICGAYNSGLKLHALCSRSAIVSNADGAVGEARTFPGGYIFAFSGGNDYFLRATFEDDRLLFANQQVWIKLKSD